MTAPRDAEPAPERPPREHPLRVLVAEDEPLARAVLRELLAAAPGVTLVGEAADGREATRLIDALRPDLVFLDVQMPERTGVEALALAEHRPAVVFTTAYDRFAVTAFELGALDYLLKPFGRERFTEALARARRALAGRNTTQAPARDEPAADAVVGADVVGRARGVFGGASAAPLARVFVRDRGRILPLPVREIVRLEADGDYVAVYARGRRFLVTLPLAAFAERLDPERFLRVHRAHLVNVDEVVALAPYDGARLQVELRDGTTLLASRTHSRALRDLAI